MTVTVGYGCFQNVTIYMITRVESYMNLEG